jgi:hypothetical protein
MNLTIANISTKVGAADLQAAVAAIGRQVDEDFHPEWDITANLRGVAVSLSGMAPIQGLHDAILYLGDSSQDPNTGVEGALGYHAATYRNIPFGFVYLDICQEYGEAWTTTLSHEVLELLADPNARLTVAGPSPKGQGSVHYDLEVCDPTQGDSYTIDNIAVSNFVGRSYFGLGGGSGRSNHLDLPLTSFGVRPGGYFQYEEGAKTYQVQGARVTKRQLAAKAKMGRGRRNARRTLRLENAGGTAMATSQTGRSLREVLATNAELRRKVQAAAAQAAYNVLKEAGVSVTAADVADAKADISALSGPSSGIHADTAGDIIAGVNTAVTIAALAGF